MKILSAEFIKSCVAPEHFPQGNIPEIAIVGRSNVGKSSLLNRLIGKSRSIVSDIAGTTRDPVDTPVDIVFMTGVHFWVADLAMHHIAEFGPDGVATIPATWAMMVSPTLRRC